MKVCITGATGFVGRALVLRLLRDGHELVAITRSAPRARDLLGSGVRLVETAQLDPAAPPAALEGCDALINLAGAPVVGKRWTAARRRELRKSRVDFTHRLVDCVAALRKPPAVVVSGSAVGYYGHRVDAPVDESAAPGKGFLAELCRDWEEAAMRAEAEFDARVVCLRIGIVLGQDGGMLGSLVPLFRAGLGGAIGRGTQPMPWIHLRELVEMIVFAVQEPSVKGPLNGVNPGGVSNARFAKTLARTLHRPSVLSVPRPALYALLGRQASVVTAGQNAQADKAQRHGFAFDFADLRSALVDIVGDRKGVSITRFTGRPEPAYLQERGASYEMRQTTVIDAPLEEVFEFFSKAENLGVLTPSSVDFKIHSPTPIAMRVGTEIDYTIKISGIPVRWKTQIAEWEPGRRFVDVQMRGPYKSWWHEHRFEADGRTTRMHDRVIYRLPLGPLGRLAHRFKVASMLEDIFAYRARMIELRFGGRTEHRAAA